MLTEKEIEAKIVDAIKALNLEGVAVIGSRQSSAASTVKGENANASAVVVVALGFRANDSFSLPTANLSGSIALSTRIERSANDALHDEILSSLASLLATWHAHGVEFSAALSTEDFFATEFRLDGGSGKTIDRSERVFEESINFTIRGAFRT